MKLSFLKPSSSFQYSINLEYDINDENKIKSFIPTSGALSIIDEVLNSVISKEEKGGRARLLTGAYGKGKSHLTLTLMSLLAGKDKKLFKNLLEKTKKDMPELYSNIKLLMDSKKKLFPIVVKTTSNDLKTNLLNSLNNALRLNGYDNLMPSTFFDVAIQTINGWKENYIETYKKFEVQTRTSGDRFIEELVNYNQEKYELFVSIYPLLTSGSTFNPMVGTDVIKLFENVINELKPFGYSGLFFVYDEFGKFLEGSLDTKTTANDLKLLQDIAERCDRSSFDEQLHLMLISHKGIDNYVGQLSKEKVDNWKGIAGRFNKMSIVSKDAEIYEMIASVLQKDKKAFDGYTQMNEGKFKELASLLDIQNKIGARSGAFTEVLETIGEDFVVDCYPLHPYSLLMLPKVSELVAQNERSIFTYLASSDKNTVSYYNKRNNDEFPLIQPDLIYDYFEPQFKGEPFGSYIRNQWQVASSAIAKLMAEGNDLSIKIVKTLSLIYIINQYEILPPSLDLIREIYSNYADGEFISALQTLRKEELLIELEFKPYVKLRNSSNNNLHELIGNEIAQLGANFDHKHVLMDNMATKYFYPVEYNDNLEITRYFEFVFVNYNEIMDTNDIGKFISSYNADGVIIAILVEDEIEKEEALNKVSGFDSNRCVYILPSKPKLIIEQLKRFKAIEKLLATKANDVTLCEELFYIKQDLSDLIRDYIDTMYLRAEQGNIEYIYNGTKVDIRRRKAFSALLSNICEKIYENSLVIVNENINKNKITSTMKTTRKKVIDKVLQSSIEDKFGLISSQDINVVRSVYVVTGIIDDLDNIRFNYDSCNADMMSVLNIIDEFVLSSKEKRVNFKELYERLTSPEYGIGLKKGVIPFFIAVILRKYKKQLVVYLNKKEIQLDAETISNINDRPSEYQIKIEQFDEAEEIYLKNLQTYFSKYTKSSDMELSRFDYVANAMQRWYYSLAKFDRETKFCCNSDFEIVEQSQFTAKMKNLLGQAEINPREMLFEKLPKFANAKDLLSVIDCVKQAKESIDYNISNIVLKTIKFIKSNLNASENVSLSSAMKDYYESLSDKTKSYMFNNSAHNLLEALRSVDNDEDKTVRKLIRNMFSLRIEDFNDKLRDAIEGTILTAIQTIGDYNSNINDAEQTQSTYTLTINNDDGTTRELSFDDAGELTYNGNFFYNNITSTIEEFSDSLTSAEKGQILLKIIKELCK